MCGIIGYFSLDKKRFEIIRKFRFACEILKRRGPDDSGKYIGKYILLGNTRLSIVSKKKITLPFQKHDCRISFNGEIFNYKEIRRELINNGYSFSTETDTEVILSAYDFYKLDFVNKLRGFFAICIYDHKINKVLLIRDRMGNKPLYYSLENKQLIFSSTQSSLIKSKLVKFIPNEKKFNDYLVFGDISGSETLHKNIFQLKPGSMIIFDGRKLIEKVYYNLENEIIIKKNNNDYNLTNEIRSTKFLRDSIKNTFLIWSDYCDDRSDVLLSGGVDSSLLSLIVSKKKKYNNAFTLDFEDRKDYNEIEDAKELSKKKNQIILLYQLITTLFMTVSIIFQIILMIPFLPLAVY